METKTVTPEQFIAAVQDYLAKHGRNMSCKEVDACSRACRRQKHFNDDVVALVACMVASVDLNMAAAPRRRAGHLARGVRSLLGN